MKFLFRIVVLALLFFLIEWFSLFFPLTAGFNSFLAFVRMHSPVMGTLTSSSLGNTSSLLNQKDQATLQSLKEDNAALSAQLHFSERTGQKPLLAHIIGTSTELDRSLLMIDRRSSDGIVPGDPVIADDGILVGSIQSCEQSHCYFYTLLDPRNSVIAKIVRTDSAVFGIVQGEFLVGLVMDYIPISASIAKGDLIVTSGRQNNVPANLIIGTIDDIQKKQEDLFQRAIIKPARDTQSLSIVSVLTQSAQ